MATAFLRPAVAGSSSPTADSLAEQIAASDRRAGAVSHLTEEAGYDPAGFEILRSMQDRHFWYLGRHRFLLHALRRQLQSAFPGRQDLAAVDLGGGCGGWIKYLRQRAPNLFQELVLADPSPTALRIAHHELGESTALWRANALTLDWRERFDVVFLLDVLEHIEDDVLALKNIWRGLRPGGLVVVAAPALQRFWSYNDDLEGHVRRYSRNDFSKLAAGTGFRLRHSRYFMFLLSPLLLAQRCRRPPLERMTAEQVVAWRRHTHRLPWPPLNQLLRLVFSCEAPLGDRVPFPWGASVVAILEKPRC